MLIFTVPLVLCAVPPRLPILWHPISLSSLCLCLWWHKYEACNFVRVKFTTVFSHKAFIALDGPFRLVMHFGCLYVEQPRGPVSFFHVKITISGWLSPICWKFCSSHNELSWHLCWTLWHQQCGKVENSSLYPLTKLQLDCYTRITLASGGLKGSIKNFSYTVEDKRSSCMKITRWRPEYMRHLEMHRNKDGRQEKRGRQYQY